MTQDLRPGAVFNEEDSNTSSNPAFEQVLERRLSRRSLLRGGAGVAGAATLGAGALTGCATHGAPTAEVRTLGFKAVPKSIADVVTVPEGYRVQVLYGLGDPLTASTPAFKNDGTDADWGHRAGDHHDGIEWFSLDASDQPSRTFNSRGLLAMNHEATTDEKLTSFFIHADGGKASLPRRAEEVDKELMIHGLSVVEVQSDGRQWRYKVESDVALVSWSS